MHLIVTIKPTRLKLDWEAGARMSEKLCVQWNDFKRDINSIFGKLRNDIEFTDITLVCEDGQQMEAHKVIMAASSPFFEKTLLKSKHPHPLIYLRGFQSKDVASILDFLYFGEANVYQEDLDSFLAIAEEIKLRGLTGETSREMTEEQEEPKHFAKVKMSKEMFTPANGIRELAPNANAFTNPSTSLPIPNKYGFNPDALDDQVKSMMERGRKMIPGGTNSKGMPKQESSFVCKVCGKEGLKRQIKITLRPSIWKEYLFHVITVT